MPSRGSRTRLLSLLLLIAAAGLGSIPAQAGDYIVRWRSSTVVLRWVADPAAPQLREPSDDLPRQAAILADVDGFLKFHCPALKGDVFVLRRDVLTAAQEQRAKQGAVDDGDCTQRGSMGMTSCDGQ